MVGQMASLRAKELNIISKINAVEKNIACCANKIEARGTRPIQPPRSGCPQQEEKERFLAFLSLASLGLGAQKSQEKKRAAPGLSQNLHPQASVKARTFRDMGSCFFITYTTCNTRF